MEKSSAGSPPIVPGESALLAEMARALTDHISACRDPAIKDGLKKSLVAPLAKQLIEHVKQRIGVVLK